MISFPPFLFLEIKKLWLRVYWVEICLKTELFSYILRIVKEKYRSV